MYYITRRDERCYELHTIRIPRSWTPVVMSRPKFIIRNTKTRVCSRCVDISGIEFRARLWVPTFRVQLHARTS